MKKIVKPKSVKLFLCINIILFTVVGILMGLVLDILLHDQLVIFLCAAYSAFFLGFLGGLIYLFRNDLA